QCAMPNGIAPPLSPPPVSAVPVSGLPVSSGVLASGTVPVSFMAWLSATGASVPLSGCDAGGVASGVLEHAQMATEVAEGTPAAASATIVRSSGGGIFGDRAPGGIVPTPPLAGVFAGNGPGSGVGASAPEHPRAAAIKRVPRPWHRRMGLAKEQQSCLRAK